MRNELSGTCRLAVPRLRGQRRPMRWMRTGRTPSEKMENNAVASDPSKEGCLTQLASAIVILLASTVRARVAG
eukprot:2552882-Amphidinium_carterae.1